jgi:hypothetical protein
LAAGARDAVAPQPHSSVQLDPDQTAEPDRGEPVAGQPPAHQVAELVRDHVEDDRRRQAGHDEHEAD